MTTQQDIPDLIAGALGVSRGTAYDLMRSALAERPAQQQEPSGWQKIECPICGDMAIATDIPAAQRKPLTDDFLRKLHHVDQFGLFCGYDEFEQIARAIEAAHGIKENT